MSLLPDREKEEVLYTEAGCVYYGILGSNIKFSLFQTMSDQIDEGRQEYGDNPGKFFFEAREAFSEAASLISPDRWRTTDLIFNPDRMIFDKGESKFYYVLGNVPAEYSIAEENLVRAKQLNKQYWFSDLRIGYKSKLVPHGNDMCLGYVQIRGMHKNPVMFEFTEGFLMNDYAPIRSKPIGQDKRKLTSRVNSALKSLDKKRMGSEYFVILPYEDGHARYKIILFSDGAAYFGDAREGQNHYGHVKSAAKTFAKLAHDDPKGFIMDLISGMTVEGPQSNWQSDPWNNYDYEDFSEDQNMNDQESPIDAADAILKWKKLLDCGAITQEEYDAKKKQILNM